MALVKKATVDGMVQDQPHSQTSNRSSSLIGRDLVMLAVDPEVGHVDPDLCSALSPAKAQERLCGSGLLRIRLVQQQGAPWVALASVGSEDVGPTCFSARAFLLCARARV